MNSQLRIVYMGTPEFAVFPLVHLIENNFNIVGVVTNIDKPAGRGKKLQESAVKKCAIEYNLPLFQPEKLRDSEFVESIKNLQPDLIIVVAFRMLPKLIWEIPKRGTFNLHSSLLPQYRGAAPINWAVVNGEQKSGVTTFFINEDIDTGSILLQKETSIGPNQTAGELHDVLMKIGAELVAETVIGIENNTLSPTPQESLFANTILKSAPKISKETCEINWNNNAEIIHNHIRGFSPFPSAWTRIKKEDNSLLLKIITSSFEISSHNHKSGYLIIEKDKIKIACNNGFIIPEIIKLEGKKEMLISEFMRGFSFESYTISK